MAGVVSLLASGLHYECHRHRFQIYVFPIYNTKDVG
jgi:hypothetical protein